MNLLRLPAGRPLFGEGPLDDTAAIPRDALTSRKIVDIEVGQGHRLYGSVTIAYGYTRKARSLKRKMKKQKLRSTTVRFTKEDLHIIAMLQRRLGLGMVQVIRVAIRRLAQLESLVISLPKPEDS